MNVIKNIYLHQQWRHLFRAIASERRLGIRSLGGIHNQRLHRPVMFVFVVCCCWDQHFPRWIRAISFHKLYPARFLFQNFLNITILFGLLNLDSSDVMNRFVVVVI